MEVTRRDFLKLAAIAGAAGLAGSDAVWAALAPERLLGFEPLGNVTLLHLTDSHATLLPVYYREPDTLLGVGAEKGQPPYLTGEAFLKHYALQRGSAEAYALTHLDFAELARRWRHHPEGLAQTLAVAERCAFRLADLRPQLPRFPLPPGVTDDEYLARLAWHGAAERWDVLTDRHRAQLEHELGVIRQLGFAGYFLIVWDIVRFARREGILCQGRGSAANSAVCFCLGITAVDPIRLGLLFERFLSEGRREPPDIDIDFAHQERERVLQYVYRRYGREHAAMVCEHVTWRGRSAVRDAARVLGFSPQQGEALAALSDRFSARATAAALREGDPPDGPADPYADKWVLAVLGRAMGRGTEATTAAGAVARDARRAETQARHDRQPLGWAPRHPRDTAAAFTDPHARDDHVERRNPVTAIRATGPGGRGHALLRRAGLDPDDPRVRLLAGLVEGLHLAPRHRSIHVGGFVLTREPLASVVPVEPAAMPDRTVIQWEKDDLDPVGLVKIDLLGLGILTLIQACVRAVRQVRGITVDLARLDYADPAVYDDLCRADTVGVFQVESRAQMNTLPRLQPRCFYDLVVEVALIRPGPIQGDMVHPYLRRRAGLEPVTYPHPSLQPILERTLGVPLFQEQGMQVAITAAGFTPAEADELRRAMGHKRSHERMAAIAAKLVEGMRRNGIPAETARKIHHQINAFADYGFPESHAASFALLVYASAWLRHYYAPEFAAAILNAQPMGFYAPGTLIEDARRHGVAVRPVCLRRSAWDCTLEPAGAGPPALRLGLRLVSGLGARARDRLAEARAAGPFTGVADVVRRTGLDRGALRALAEAGAFDAFVAHEPPGRRRRAALWAVLEAARGHAGPLAPVAPSPPAPAIPPMSPWELTEADYRMTALSLNGHPMTHLRAALAPLGVATAARLHGEADPPAPRDGDPVVVAGLVICRQRPGTAKGFVFLTLEDETGMVNVVCTPRVFERQALLVSRAPLLLARGVLQVEGRVVNVRAAEFEALAARVGAEHARPHDFR
mgnify:CR=1 FL=1